jgi:hypothetical protein
MMMLFENDLFGCVVYEAGWRTVGGFVVECSGEITHKIPLNSAASFRNPTNERT